MWDPILVGPVTPALNPLLWKCGMQDTIMFTAERSVYNLADFVMRECLHAWSRDSLDT